MKTPQKLGRVSNFWGAVHCAGICNLAEGVRFAYILQAAHSLSEWLRISNESCTGSFLSSFLPDKKIPACELTPFSWTV